MSFRKVCHALTLAVSVSVIAALPASASPAPSGLGHIEFPTSGSPEAQRHFLRGVAALHSFWYEEARNSFRKSTAASPNFMMGYWGEAMTHTRPIWREEDLDAGRAAIAKTRTHQKLTAREQGYLNAVRILYGKGEKQARDKAYSSAMAKIHQDYPDDLEAACFYALSLLGLARGSHDGYRLQIQAGAVTLEVFRKKPNHPCAAHYTIHAFDHPDLAILALPAARRYARIAPESHHAQHMPAHIFVQLGMWPDAAASNKAGWKESLAWVEREGLPWGHRDYHSLHWLLYTYLQQGRYKAAEQVLTQKRTHMQETLAAPKPTASSRPRKASRYYGRMMAAFVVETERWDAAAGLASVPGWKPSKSARAVMAFVQGLAAAMQGQPEAQTHVATLQALRKQRGNKDPFHKAERLDIWAMEVRAAALASSGDYEGSIAIMKEATALEEELPPPSGPPRIIKPSHELLGEILLLAGKPTEAAEQFSISLKRHPNRARPLLGAARAAEQAGDRAEAVERYAKLLEIWSKADPELPDLREATRVTITPQT